MTKKYNDSPPLAPTTRPNCEASQSTDSPRPLYKRGGRVSRRCRLGTTRSKNEKRGESIPEAWPPRDLALPDTIEGIEAGRRTQPELFPEPIDGSREGRMTRMLGPVTTKSCPEGLW